MTAQLDHQPSQLSPRVAAPSRLGQGTAIEQSRAVAEVEAAIVVAMRHPRNVPAAIEAMRESCRRKELADRAFFRYKRGSGAITGPSVHLARELARVWGNIQYGLTELRRDDDYGQSEMLAFAWDVQTNSRCSSVVINPHRGYTGGRELTELRDIYENNANVGARRVREAIFAVLPAWFTEEAKDICTRTIADGGGVPLPQRIANAIEVFGNLGITVAQLEDKLGAPTAKWTDQDVAQLRVIRQSLLRGEISRDDEFPPPRLTKDDITGGQEAPAPDGGGRKRAARSGRPTPAAGARIGKLLTKVKLGSPDDLGVWLAWTCDRMAARSLEALTRDEADQVEKALKDALRAADDDGEEAASRLWTEFHQAAQEGSQDDGEADGSQDADGDEADG